MAANSVAAAVVAAHEEAQLLTHEQALGCSDRGRPVLAYFAKEQQWIMVAPEPESPGRFSTFAAGVRHVFRDGELTHFRRLPPAPGTEEGR